MTSSLTPLPVGVGYGVVVGIGFFFALVMCGISYIQVCIYLRDCGQNADSHMTEPLHQVLHQGQRGVQYRQSQCQAGSNRKWCVYLKGTRGDF